MTTVLVLSGFAGALLAVAALGWSIGYLVRSLALFLPPAGQFLGDVTALREQAPQPSAQLPAAYGASGPASWPTRRDRGIAPPPIDTLSETGASFPPVNAGDRDWFDTESIEALAHAQRPVTSKAGPPPGPTLDSER